MVFNTGLKVCWVVFRGCLEDLFLIDLCVYKFFPYNAVYVFLVKIIGSSNNSGQNIGWSP